MVQRTYFGRSIRYTQYSLLLLEMKVYTVCVDKLEPPVRDIAAPLRMPVSNVFKGQGSGTRVSGRLCAGVVQVGERVRILPGDESAVVKCMFDFLDPLAPSYRISFSYRNRGRIRTLGCSRFQRHPQLD